MTARRFHRLRLTVRLFCEMVAVGAFMAMLWLGLVIFVVVGFSR